MGGVLFALGSQPPFHEVNGRNGWVNYPTHTYGAVVSILGVTALVLWLTRLYAEGRFRVPIVLVLVVLAVLTNLRYELVFPAGPLSLVALLLVPVTPTERAAEGRRAKWVTGISFVGVFMVVLVALRGYVRRVCGPTRRVLPGPRSACRGTSRVRSGRTSLERPGGDRSPCRGVRRGWGVSPEAMYTPTPWSVVVGGGMVVALLAGWWSTRPGAAGAWRRWRTCRRGRHRPRDRGGQARGPGGGTVPAGGPGRGRE